MAKALIVHDDSTLSRVAWLIEQRKEAIRWCEHVLKSKPEDLPTEYYHVNRDQVRQRLELERWCLNDLLEDIEDGLFVRELQKIEREYVIAKEEEK